jgi:2-methylisocitrate lyase-like PEP mutase family enzyme
MLARMRSGIGGITAIVIVVMAMWMWARSAELSAVLATQPLHPLWEMWAVRCAALAAAAGAQWLLLSGVVCAFYEEHAADQIVRTVVGLIGSMAAVAAMLLALLGR